MATAIKQIYTFINTVSSMALGKAAVTVTDTKDLTSLGETVLSTTDNTSAFYEALANVIGKTYALYRALPAKRLGITRDALTFGAILRTLSVKEIAKARANKSYDTTNPDTQKVYQDTTKVYCEYFQARGVFEIEPKTIYDIQLEGCFSGASEFVAFTDLIFQDMYNGMEMSIRDCENTTVCTGIAVSAAAATTKSTCINVLGEYNVKFNKTLTSTEAWTDPDFLRFAGAFLKKHMKQMTDPSIFYNAKGYQKWTEPEEQQVHVLAEFADNTSTYLASDTFHNELVSLPSYRSRNFWQGIGEDNTLKSRSMVSIENGDVKETVYGVFAFVFDYDAIAVMIDKIRTKSKYEPEYEHTTYFHKADWGSLVRTGEQMVTFYIDDYTPIKNTEPSNWSTEYASYYVRNTDEEYVANDNATFDTTKQYYKKIN